MSGNIWRGRGEPVTLALRSTLPLWGAPSWHRTQLSMNVLGANDKVPKNQLSRDKGVGRRLWKGLWKWMVLKVAQRSKCQYH